MGLTDEERAACREFDKDEHWRLILPIATAKVLTEGIPRARLIEIRDGLQEYVNREIAPLIDKELLRRIAEEKAK